MSESRSCLSSRPSLQFRLRCLHEEGSHQFDASSTPAVPAERSVDSHLCLDNWQWWIGLGGHFTCNLQCNTIEWGPVCRQWTIVKAAQWNETRLFDNAGAIQMNSEFNPCSEALFDKTLKCSTVTLTMVRWYITAQPIITQKESEQCLRSHFYKLRNAEMQQSES